MLDRKWFVRASGHIRGPFTEDQLLQLHRRGQLDRLHEVSHDRSSWRTAEALLDRLDAPGNPSSAFTLPRAPAVPNPPAWPPAAPEAPPKPRPPLDEFNPYAAPEASRSADLNFPDPNEGRGVWQDGDVLVMAKVARLPSRCVKCNQPATNWLRRTLYWHHQAIYLILILLSPLIYIIVALIVRKTLEVEIPLCDEHRASRRGAILFSWLLALGGLALCFAPAIDVSLAPAILVGLVVIVVALISGAVRSQVVSPRKIDDTHAWLKKVSPLYLASLPPLPSPYDQPKPSGVGYDVEL